MTTEELLRPRYKVIADYFYNPYKIGDIITVMYEDRSVHLTTTRYRDEFGEMVDQHNYMHPGELKKFPHLFQPLPWWSGRDINDMPEYVKITGAGCTIKQDSIVLVEGVGIFDDPLFDNIGELYVLLQDKYSDERGLTKMNCMHCIPATRAEYEAFNPQNNQQ